MQRFDIRHLVTAAAEFERRIEAVKSENRDNVSPGWYPYPTLTSVGLMERLIKGPRRDISQLIGGRPLLDIGAGDGDLAFFFESLGVEVHALDNASSNYNRMRGIQALKEALNSAIEIRSADLDRQFTLHQTYGLVLFLGVLYHLKNPFYTLEAIARRAEYCILSTRIARVSPDGRVSFEAIPVAYLVDDRETNDDPTNFWIFSETGLKLLLERSGWEICDFITTGHRSNSDPVRGDRDERAFCLLRSRITDYTSAVRLESGWHQLEDEKWRWTARSFSVLVDRPADAGEAVLLLRFYVPDTVIQSLGKVAIQAEVNGALLEKQIYKHAGELLYRAAIPASAADREILHVTFTLDETFSPAGDNRDLGILVSFAGQFPILITREV